MTDTEENRTKTDNVKECRACLVKIDLNSGCFDLFRSWDPPWSGMGLSIAEDLGKLANIKISMSDTLSKFICRKCCVRLRYACNFARIVKNTDIILRRRLKETSKAPSWPKPIQVDKSIASVYREQMNVEIKQEVVTEDEDISDTELSNPDLDIKVEPEESQEPFQIEINCKNQQTPFMNGSNGSENLDEVMQIDVKDEPMSDEEMEIDFSLSNECILCAKPFNTRSGLKAHVIAFHTYDTVTSPRVDRHICTTCKRSFATRTDLCVHETCHSQYACYACDKMFDSFIQLTRHRTKDCMKDDTLPRLKTLEDVVRPLPIYYITSRNTDDVKSEAQKGPKETDDPNNPESKLDSSLKEKYWFENVPKFVSQDTNLRPQKDTNLGAPIDTSLEAQIFQKSGSQEVSTPETVSYPTAIEPIRFPVTKDTESSRSFDKTELGNYIPDTGKPIQNSAETNSMEVDSVSKSIEDADTIQLPIQISNETDSGFEQLGSKNNHHVKENETQPEKSSSNEEITLGLDNSSKANTEIAEIIKINIEDNKKTGIYERTSSDLENDSETNTRTEKTTEIHVDNGEIAPGPSETYDGAIKIQELRVTSPKPVAKESETNTKAENITQPNQVEFKSTTDVSVESDSHNDRKEIINIQTISNTQQSQEPIETSRVNERIPSPDLNDAAEKESDKNNTKKEEESECYCISRIIEPENKNEPDIDFERKLSYVNTTSIRNKIEGNLEMDEIIQDSLSINPLPTIETEEANSEQIIKNKENQDNINSLPTIETEETNSEQIILNKENQNNEKCSLEPENLERDVHKESMDIENRPKDILDIEKEPSESSMEVESPQEKGMEIQLEIHSVEKEQGFEMDVDSEFDSELKINNTESDSQNA